MHVALAIVPLAERKESPHGLVLMRKLTSGVMLPVHPESGWAIVITEANARASAGLRSSVDGCCGGSCERGRDGAVRAARLTVESGASMRYPESGTSKWLPMSAA